MKLLWLNDALNLKAENDRERDTLRLLYGSLLSLTEEEKQVHCGLSEKEVKADARSYWDQLASRNWPNRC